MPLISAFAVYFIIWWTVLFAMLPFSLRTQDEAGDVTLGTVSSAPQGRHMLRAALRTTIVATTIFAGLWLMTNVWGITIDDLPKIVPEMK